MTKRKRIKAMDQADPTDELDLRAEFDLIQAAEIEMSYAAYNRDHRRIKEAFENLKQAVRDLRMVLEGLDLMVNGK
jgi:hypothetical protein